MDTLTARYSFLTVSVTGTEAVVELAAYEVTANDRDRMSARTSAGMCLCFMLIFLSAREWSS